MAQEGSTQDDQVQPVSVDQKREQMFARLNAIGAERDKAREQRKEREAEPDEERESVALFLDRFERYQSDIRNDVDTTTSKAGEMSRDDLKKDFERVSKRVNELQETVAQSSFFLPAYELRQANRVRIHTFGAPLQCFFLSPLCVSVYFLVLVSFCSSCSCSTFFFGFWECLEIYHFDTIYLSFFSLFSRSQRNPRTPFTQSLTELQQLIKKKKDELIPRQKFSFASRRKARQAKAKDESTTSTETVSETKTNSEASVNGRLVEVWGTSMCCKREKGTIFAYCLVHILFSFPSPASSHNILTLPFYSACISPHFLSAAIQVRGRRACHQNPRPKRRDGSHGTWLFEWEGCQYDESGGLPC